MKIELCPLQPELLTKTFCGKMEILGALKPQLEIADMQSTVNFRFFLWFRVFMEDAFSAVVNSTRMRNI